MSIVAGWASFVLTPLSHAGSPSQDAVIGINRPQTEASIRDSLGRCEGQAGFDPSADLYGDGCVNVLDLAIFRPEANPHNPTNNSQFHAPAVRPYRGVDSDGRNSAQAGGTENILVEPEFLAANHGNSFSVLFKIQIQENPTPLLGYSLDVAIVPDVASVGSITADVAARNFYDKQNLIVAAGVACHPVFCVINDVGDGGVFVNAITENNSAVTAVEDINDVFAQVFFDVSSDACGEFTIQLGPASALSDEFGFPVPFGFSPGAITVSVQEPTIDAIGPRYLSVTPAAGDEPVAILVTSPDLPCLAQYVDSFGTLVDSPVFQTPGIWGSIEVTGEAILPERVYTIQVETATYSSLAPGATTWNWGDVNNTGVVDLDGISCIIAGFGGDFTQCAQAALDPMGCTPEGVMNLDDILGVIGAFGSADPCLYEPLTWSQLPFISPPVNSHWWGKLRLQSLSGFRSDGSISS